MGIVTKVEVCKKNKNRVNIFVDNEFFMSAFLEVAYLNQIKSGTVINEKNLNELLSSEELKKAESYAIKLLSKFIKTEIEVKKKLLEKGFSVQTINLVLSKLKTYGYVNDKAYAKNYKAFNENNKSPLLIKQQLKQKGVSDELINNLTFDYETELNTAKKLALKWLKNKTITKEILFKLSNYLYSKGFNPEICKKVVLNVGDVDVNLE